MISPNSRRALDVLAGSPAGCTEALLLVRGFTADALATLILDGFAGADTERMWAGGKVVDVRRFKITGAERRVIENIL